jgi:hypothetical protein
MDCGACGAAGLHAVRAKLAGTSRGLMLVPEKPGDTLRVVFKISTSVGGAVTGQMYSLDHGGQAGAGHHTEGFDFGR